MKLHFLHIAKTGGTALRETLKPFNEQIKLHNHPFRMADMPPRGRAIFVVREPVERFVSGFNSRLRKGQPRHKLAWTPGEERAFTRFTTPNALAEAITSADAEEQAAAHDAMTSLIHAARPLVYWTGEIAEFEARRDRVAWIGHQPTLTADFDVLKRAAGLPDAVALPSDPVRSHATPAGYDKTLSETGHANIAQWFKADYPVYRACLEVREQLIDKVRAAA